MRLTTLIAFVSIAAFAFVARLDVPNDEAVYRAQRDAARDQAQADAVAEDRAVYIDCTTTPVR
jgi:hypothetical protein